MPKDFAGRGEKRKPRPRAKNNRRASPKARVLFHGPSFSSGAIVGAAIVVLAAYAPDLLRQTGADPAAATPQKKSAPVMDYKFPELLAESEVKPEPEIYAPEPPPAGSDPQVFHIQAASFRSDDDAHNLRAQLLLQNLPAAVDSKNVAGKVWYRVVVGPFDRKVEADRALTTLRKMYLQPIWLNKHN